MKTLALLHTLALALPLLFTVDAATAAEPPNNYTLLWRETVQGNPRLHLRAGFTKQSCEDAAAKLAQMSAFCEATPNEMPTINKTNQKENEQ